MEKKMVGIGLNLGNDVLRFVCIGMLQDMKENWAQEKFDVYRKLHDEYSKLTDLYLNSVDDNRAYVYDIERSAYISANDETEKFETVKEIKDAQEFDNPMLLDVGIICIVAQLLDDLGEGTFEKVRNRFIVVPYAYSRSMLL